MPDQTTFESRLGAAYDRFLAGAPVEVDAALLAAQVVTGSAQGMAGDARMPRLRLGMRGSLDRRWVALLLAAVLVLASLLAVGVGRWLELNALRLSDPRGTPSMEAIYVRGTGRGDIDVFAVRPGGAERLVRSLSSSMLPGGLRFAPSGKVSEDGWIALGTEMSPGGWCCGGPGGGWALIDLGAANPAARLVETNGGPSSAWSPNGWFASPFGLECCPMQLTNPRTGEIIRTETNTRLPGAGPDAVWALDGSGLLVQRDIPGQGRYGLLPRSGGIPLDIVPELAFRGPRYVKAGGTELIVPTDGIWLFDDVREPADWMGGEPPDFNGASFTADGGSMWLLFDKASGQGREAILASESAPGVMTTVWRRALKPDVTDLSIGAFALDDSLVTIWTSHVADAGQVVWSQLLISLPDGDVASPSGSFAGFIRGSVMEAWR